MIFHSSRGYYHGNIHILWKYPHSVDIIRILSDLYLNLYSSSESDWCNGSKGSVEFCMIWCIMLVMFGPNKDDILIGYPMRHVTKIQEFSYTEINIQKKNQYNNVSGRIVWHN